MMKIKNSTDYGKTPLYIADVSRHSQPHTSTESGKTPLHEALEKELPYILIVFQQLHEVVSFQILWKYEVVSDSIQQLHEVKFFHNLC